MATQNASGPVVGQFGLFRLQQFRPFFLTQFTGAFNDNLYKNALLVLMTFTAAPVMGLPTDIVINLAALLFILPFFLFSALAGQIADKYEKSLIIRRVKQLEVAIMALAGVGLVMEWYPLLLALLFLMGTQSAFFGPVKYAIIPQHLGAEELVGANALVSVGTFTAILLGTIVGSVLATTAAGTAWVALAVLVLAVLGYRISCAVPEAPSADPEIRLSGHLLRETFAILRLAREKEPVFLSLLAISWFWFVGAAYLTQIPNFGATTLAAAPSAVTIMLAMFVVGIGIGSMLCERLSGRHIELGIVPIGSFGLSLFGIDLFFAVPSAPLVETLTWKGMLEFGPYRRILLDLVGIGAFGGLFIVPLYAFIQHQSTPDRRARVIAALNILNALFMVASAVAGLLLLGFAGFTIPEFLLLVALVNIVVCAYLYIRMPVFVLRCLAWLLAHAVSRVRQEGLENIPDEGPVLLVCSRLSPTGILVVAGAVKRPIRFVLDKRLCGSPGWGRFFGLARAIPANLRRPDLEIDEAGMAAVSTALANGEVVCISPGEKTTSETEAGPFRTTLEAIVEGNPARVMFIVLQELGHDSGRGPDGLAVNGVTRRFWSPLKLKVSASWQAQAIAIAPLEKERQRLGGDGA